VNHLRQFPRADRGLNRVSSPLVGVSDPQPLGAQRFEPLGILATLQAIRGEAEYLAGNAAVLVLEPAVVPPIPV
jgi:hypothetical protein